jgi:biotin carboxylase
MKRAGSAPVTPAAGRSAVNGLMVAFTFTLPYHVMRVAHAAGIQVHVLGSDASRGLKMSRCGRAYHEMPSAAHPEALLAEIGELVRAHSIDIIFPSDDVSTRLLATLADRLPAPCVPLPDLATFDLLNDKWNFTQFCQQNGIRAPQARLFDSLLALRQALDSGEIALPLTIKPTNRSGGAGVLHLREPADLALLDTVDYRPILAQRHIIGKSVSITMLCDHGKVLAHVAQERDAKRFRVFANTDLLDNVTWLATLTGYHGIANFDAVLSDEDGRAYLVECNPRFWYSVYLVAIAGLNFVKLALAPPREVVTLDAREFRLSLRQILTQPWRANRLEWKYLLYCLGDPVTFALQRAKSYDDSEVAVPTGQMMAPAGMGRPISAWR